MFGSRRVALAREALTSVTAWAELVVGPERAQQLASDAVVSAASARSITTLSDLARAARDDIAHALAHGEARVPTLLPLDGLDATHPAAVAAARATAAQAAAAAAGADEADAHASDQEPVADEQASDPEASAPYLPGNEASDHDHDHESPLVATVRHRGQEQDQRTPAERLADALAALHPHERLAAIRFYLDGESVTSIAQMFGIARPEAVALLESVTAILAPIVGEYDLPDFAADVDEIEVMTR
jgi:DNA-directed RNA polymerase specialized sigma24 family protein